MSDLIEFEARVQRKAEDHLTACFEALELRETDADAEIEDPAYGPFCGCTTCLVREVLSVCWDEMLAEAKHQTEEPDAQEEVDRLTQADGTLRHLPGSADRPR